uniref:Spermatogenesis associated 22 n=1 Tax=Acanthochromis polyacanthus TaxID=80966 RepID=A0A3Q1F640_9TELE
MFVVRTLAASTNKNNSYFTYSCLSVPLFNQKKRNRIPLTSTPSENEFFSHSEYMASLGSIFWCSPKAPVEQTGHPTICSTPAAWQQQTCSWTGPCSESLWTYSTSIQSWKQKVPFINHLTIIKPAIENSLRILTAVIDGMRHWSQFRDKVPYLFEIFATLDSAVTLGRYGAKNFLIRDGKDVVQCVFYENQVLPRLIRGQVHRCVGNYDRSRDVLICVSVRPGLPSELRNAQEAVKACDAEMRLLVKLLSEV